jgi:eukaryotic-like serine/threonine-protein kinase
MADSPSLLGQTFSHYRILEKLGAGGMGEVYRAHDEHLQRDVALKLLPVELVTNLKARARLRREAQTAAALNHPHICTVYEVADAQGVIFVAMELIKGRTLSERISHGLPIEIWFKYARQISEAVAHAHGMGILHRDIKASNVMISYDDCIKVVDFGLAKRLQEGDAEITISAMTADKPGQLVGTLPYAAPEVLRGETPDFRSDVWSLGVLLFEMLTGSRPFKGRTTYEVTSAILNGKVEAIPLNAGSRIQAVILRCLRKLPSERFQQAGEVRAALEIAATENVDRAIRLAPRKLLFLPLVAIAALIILWQVYHEIKTRTRSSGREGQLAVLPIKLSDADPTTVAFGDGLAETLTARLTQLMRRHAIQVVPMSAVQAKNISSAKKAREEFGADLGLELHVRRSKDQIRVTFNLVDAKSTLQLGGGTVTGNSADIFDVEDQVCEEVAKLLDIQFQPLERETLLRNQTSAPSAYDFYVQGRGYLQSFNHPESIESAISVFQHALQLDQDYGPAFAGLGQAYWKQYESKKDNKWIALAKQNCQRAVELNNHGPEGHICLGMVLSGTGQYESALKEFQTSIELDPTDDESYMELATAYNNLGNTNEAEATYRRAIRLRPSYPLVYNRLGEFQMTSGQFKEAAKTFKQVIALAPDNFAGYTNLGGAYLLDGRYSDAILMFEHSIAIERTAETLSNLATAYFQARRFEDAAGIYAEAVQLDERNYEVWGNLGDAYYWSPGLRSKAPEAYEKASSLALAALTVNGRDPNALGYLAEYQAMLGRQKPSMEYLERCLRLDPQDPNLLFNAALIYNRFGDQSATLNWLQKAVRAGLPKSALLESPNFDNLHANPGFLEIVK